MTTRTVRIDDRTELYVESIGDENPHPLLLLGGATWSKDWWDDELCARFVSAGYRVVRFDPRDTGESTAYPTGAPAYTGADLVTDAVVVLDRLGIRRAHVAGLSMGGGIAQELAAWFRDRVASLTLISTSPVDPAVGDLPGATPRIRQLFAEAPAEPDWTDPAAVVDHIVEGERAYAGPGNFDEDRLRAIAAQVVGRTRNLPSAMTNHFVLAEGDQSPTSLADLAGVPTLVVHGTADPMFPLEHGRALADAIPGARFLALDDVGHQLPPPHTWDRLIAAMASLR
jgi:pimeloyl-ACP methyl ester carboxylesterase